jgi:predicted type IV restriction endonuclease
VRREFIDPLFCALGWDVDNTCGYAQAYKDVVHEDAIKVGLDARAPDYSFRIGGTRKFFVEAKKPAVNLKDDPAPAYQLRRYAWSAKLPLSILTDFQEFAVYDSRVRPANTDKASVARTLYMPCEQYEERWEEIAGVFAKEAILQGSFDRYAESTKVKKGTTEVDASFLKEIESWRDSLARNIALRNPSLTQRELNYAVQVTIDRLIFLRICEDRGIEPYGRLRGLVNGQNVYSRLREIYVEADHRYNSGLFHFEGERGRADAPDRLTLSLAIDDKPLKDILKRLYYPDSPYEFSVLPADILGQVYEQFLGKVIRLTAGHRAVVEDKPEVKKAGGVYYTPTYIVDYIVEHTVGRLLEGKTPKQAGELRILDPACGSGSFLIGAYQHLLDWHLRAYSEHPEKHRKELVQGRGGEWQLTTAEKKRILLANIYGVDIDAQAVETTKLSLLLKVLEGETSATIESQLSFLHERALPDLAANIKCGNSLIGPDFYDDQQLGLAGLDEGERYRINVFDWEAEFPEILGKAVLEERRGFDAVIGNPPWGASFDDASLAYLRRAFASVVVRMVDSYIYFSELTLRLTHSVGYVGLIVPATILNQADARLLRASLLTRPLHVLVNLGQRVFGPRVLNTSVVFVIGGERRPERAAISDLSRLENGAKPKALGTVERVDARAWVDAVGADESRTFFAGSLQETQLLQRLRHRCPTLASLIDGRIERGVSPDMVGAHVLTAEKAQELDLEGALLRPSLSGRALRRFQPPVADQVLLYTTRDTPIERHPNAQGWLNQWAHRNSCREVAAGKHPSWALHRPRDPSIFKSPKFIGLTTSKTFEVVFDATDDLYVTDAMYVFRIRAGLDPRVVLGLMHSRLLLFLYQVANQGEARVIPQVKAAKLNDMPVPALDTDSAGCRRIADVVDQVVAVTSRLQEARMPSDIEALRRETSGLVARLDRLIYDLYGLSDDEIALVEAV